IWVHELVRPGPVPRMINRAGSNLVCPLFCDGHRLSEHAELISGLDPSLWFKLDSGFQVADGRQPPSPPHTPRETARPRRLLDGRPPQGAGLFPSWTNVDDQRIAFAARLII